MKRFFLALLFLLFIGCTFSFSQKTEKNPAELTGDTVEGLSTDTSIVYIIKKPPVRIKEKVEIQRLKIKQQYYLSFDMNGFLNSEKMKASAGYENYVKTLSAHTSELPGYSIGGKIWKAPEKFIIGISVNSKRIVEAFDYTDQTATRHKFTNNYNYVCVGLHAGWWFKKGQTISYMAHGGLLIDDFLSVKGFTLDKSDLTSLVRINRAMSYNKFSGSFTAGFTVVLAIKNSFLEAEPYIIIAPFSATPKKEVYALTRNFVGLRIGYTNKLF
jgi:hypothetical protein